MARSPLTLAAAVTSALPRVGVVGVAPLSESGAGRYDSALVHLDDGRRVIIRVPETADAGDALERELAARRALTAGVRSVLGFSAPEVFGRVRMGQSVAVVESQLTGYRVEADHIPPGRGVATGLGRAVAAVHGLPASVVQAAGLPARTAAQVRADAETLLDAAEATGRLPFGLLRRWSRAVALDDLWRFETTVTLGGVDPADFTFEDVDGVPTVGGLLVWAGLSVSDPAEDLRWAARSPAATADVLAAYAGAMHRTPDGMLAERARLHAELEFAKWLVHGHETGSESIMADAAALLDGLDESVRDEPALSQGLVTVDDAIAAIGRVPAPSEDAIDTSMQTDAYDPGMGDFGDDEEPTPPVRSVVDLETEPIEHSDWAGQDLTAPIARSDTEVVGRVAAEVDGRATADDDVDRDPDEAARNALRRWTGTA